MADIKLMVMYPCPHDIRAFEKLYEDKDMPMCDGLSGIFPKAEFDTTLRTESLFRFPTATPANYAEAKRMFNFGLIEIAEDGKLVASMNDLNGVALYELVLDPR